VQIRVVGSTPQLGDWDPEKGLELYTNYEYWPCWIARDPINLPLNQKVEYNYAILNMDGQILQWASNTRLTYILVCILEV